MTFQHFLQKEIEKARKQQTNPSGFNASPEGYQYLRGIQDGLQKALDIFANKGGKYPWGNN